MTKQSLAIASFAAMTARSGCALTTDRIDIQYDQLQGVGPVQGSNGVSVNVQVTDQRQDKSKVSAKKNGYGMEMAPILATEDVSVIVRRAVEQELRARGFQVASDAALIKITADLTRFYNDFKMGFFAGDAVAELNMSVTMKAKNGDLLYSRQVIVQGVEQNVQLASGDNARIALNRALQNGVKVLFEDQAFLSALVASPVKKLTSVQP